MSDVPGIRIMGAAEGDVGALLVFRVRLDAAKLRLDGSCKMVVPQNKGTQT